MQGQSGYVGYSPLTRRLTTANVAVVNQGTIQADVSGGTITVYGTNIQNTGTFDAANSGTLSLQGSGFTNSGVIGSDTGSTISIGGTIDNTGSVFSPTGSGTVTVKGTIEGGTVSVGTGTNVNLASSTLDGVTISGNFTLAGNNVIEIQGGLTLDGTLTLGSGGTYGYLYFVGGVNQTLGGSGTVTFSGTSTYDTLGLTSGTLTIGSGITIQGQSGYVGYSPLLGGSPSVVNDGTIEADTSGGTITVEGTNIQNTGTFDAANSGTLSLQGSGFTNSGVIGSDTGSTISIGGTIDNTGSVFSLTGSGTVTINGTIEGGTVSVGTGTMLNLSGTVEGVRINGNFTVSGDNGVTVQDGLTLNGTLTLGTTANSSYYGWLTFAGTQTLGGSGTVVFGAHYYDSLVLNTANTTLTIGPGITVRGQTGYVGDSPYTSGVSPVAVVNQGTIQADVSGGIITVNGTGSQNTGTLSALDGAILSVQGSDWHDSGLNYADATSSFAISASFSNSGTTIALTGPGMFSSTGTIQGGTVSVASGTTLNLSGTLDGATVVGNALVSGNSDTTVEDGLTLDGTLTLGTTANSSYYGWLTFAGTQTLGGSGTVVFGAHYYDSLVLNTANTTLTIGPGITVRGKTGYVGDSPYTSGVSPVAVVNQGTIQADVSGGTITVNGTDNQNAGSLNALNGGTLAVEGTLTNTTTISVDSTSVLTLGGTLTGGTITGQVGAVVQGSTLNGVTLSGSFQLTGGNYIEVEGGLTLDGTLTLGTAGSSTYGYVYFLDSQALGGTGTVDFAGSHPYNSLGLSSGTLTIGSGITVQGQEGYIGYSPVVGGSPSNITVINQGTIEADSSGGTIYVYGTNNQNAGTLAALDGATLSLEGTLTNSATISVDSTSVLALGGTLTGGTITGQVGAVVQGSTLNGVTLSGSFQLTGGNYIEVEGGLTLDGTLMLGTAGSSTYGYVYFLDSQALGGTGTVDFAGSHPYNSLGLSSGTLTIGSGITVQGQEGYIGYSPAIGGSPSSITVVNQGTIEADASGGTIYVYGTAGTFQNSGTINSSAGPISIYTGGYGTVNSGNVAAGPTGTLSITGPYTQTATGTFDEVLGGSSTGLYGQTSISGTVSLNGSLNITEANGFSPNTGNIFTFLTYTSETGQFANYTGLVLSSSAALQPAYNLTNATLTTVTDTTIAPDLRVTNLSINPADPQSSQSVTVNWDDLNAGNGATGASWTDQVLVTNTTTGQTIATGYVPYNAATNGSLAPNDSAAQSYTFNLPDGTAGAGSLQISVTTDYYNNIPEFYPGNVGETNNTTTITAVSTLAAYPDLQVSGLTVATANPQSGQPITVDWNDANTGAAPVNGPFSDYVTVVNTTTGQSVASAIVSYDEGTSGPIAAGSSAAQQYTFTLPDGNPGVGQLQVTVTTDYYNQIYESNSSGTAETNNTSSTTTTSSLAPYPDLQVTGLSTTPSSPQSGQPMTVDWNDANAGAAPVSGSFSDYLTVVNTTTGQTVASAIVSYNEGTSGPIAAGSSAEQQYTFTLPDGNPGVGQLQVAVATDYYNQVFEYNASGTAETNNASSVTTTSTIARYPDLLVSSINLSPASGLVSGGALTIDWTDSNAGNASTPGAWTDQVVLVNTTTGQTLLDQNVNYDPSTPGNGAIVPNGSRDRSTSFTLPQGSPGVGDLQVTVNTNASNSFFEWNSSGTGQSNNTSAAEITSTLAPYPDLQVSGLTVNPASPVSGSAVAIDWNDANTGNAPVSSSFYDNVTVTNTTTGQLVASGDVYYDASATGSGPIAAGLSAPSSFDFTLPNGAPGIGNLSVKVTTDYYNQVFENNGSGTAESNNSATVTATSIAAQYPDLQVQGLAVSPTSPTSGSTVQVTWDDANTGNAPVDSAFVDNLTIVNNTTGETLLNTDVPYDPTLPGNSPIDPGGSQPQAYSFTLPQGSAGVGNLTVTVTTDVNNQVFEYNASGTGETNNTATLAATSVLAPYPDLAVSDVTAAASAAPGQQLTIGWTLTNSGDAAAPAPWTEQVFLATDAAGDNPTLLHAQTDSSSLGAGQSVPRSAEVTVPSLSAGNYWFEVIENPFAQVFEVNTANNTAVAASPTSIAGALTLTGRHVATTVSNAAGSDATTATVTRNTDTTDALDVTIANSDPNDVTVPQTVTIPAGATSVTFPVGTINNHVVEGTQTATLTASATGEVSGSGTLTVTDTNVPTLTLVLNTHTVNETDTNPAAYGTVTRNTLTTSALTVSLVSNDINKLTVPTTVTIPAGQTSVTFPVTVVNDQQLDGNVTTTITASASGFVNASDSASVIDDNIPALTLTLADQTVSEAAGASATTGTVSIANPASSAITITLTSSDTSAATVPTSVVIGAGQVSASFPIAAVDDGLDTGDKTAVISASVETNTGVIVNQGSTSVSLLLKEADGPALTLSLSPSTVSKGTTGTATITRNTDTNGPLLVSLASSDPTKASVPPTVTIPAGQAAVSFIVTAIDDHTPDGLQHVQITASATGLDTGIASLGITDVDLPDLVLSSVSAPTSGYDNAPLEISWTVTNTGQYPASGSWLDQIYLDPVGGPQSTTPADTVPFTGTVNAGQIYTQTDTLTFPSTVGQYTVRVVADSNQFVQELSFFNNSGTSAQALNDQAAYQVTLVQAATTVSNGTPVEFSGVATMTSNGTPASNVPVAVQVMVAGTTRTLTAMTDSSGAYSVTFQPLPNEAGQYSVTADDPGVTNPAIKWSLLIIGMTASPASANVTVVPNTPLTGQFTLTNLGDGPLADLTATASGGPAGLNVQLSPPSQVPGNGTATFTYTLDESLAQAASGVVTIQITTNNPAEVDIPLGVTVVPLAPILATNPGYLNSGMVVGAQSLVSFTVSNTGGSPTGDLQVSLPSTSYMTLASPATIPSLSPGASSTVTLELSAAATLPLEQYTGTIAINGGQAGISVPFTFTAISSAVGTVHVLVDDDYTFQEAGTPHVQGATVNLLNPYDNTDVVATGVTDATGAVTFSNVPAGPYELQVQASGHSSYESSYTVVPGITNNDEVFVARQFVTYTFNVVQTRIQDQYQIQLQTQFATDVPAPVVTISAPSAIPTLAPGQSGTFNITITNHGLIAAQGVTLTLPTDVEYTFTALSNDIGEVPAGRSVVVPVTVTRLAPLPVYTPFGNAVLMTEVEVPGPIGAHTNATVYVDYANTGTAPMPAPLLVLTATQNGSTGAWLTLNPALQTEGFNTSAAPTGFSQSVEILASGATPGVLEPGESERIPVYYVGWYGLPTLVPLVAVFGPTTPVKFSLTTLTADNTTAANWSSLLAASEPSALSAAGWSTISANLQSQLGTKSGGYVQLLDNEASYLGTLGENVTDVQTLWGFAMQQADNALNPLAPFLTSATDDSVAIPGGLSLSFSRFFAESISGRDTMGPLGMGWSTNWQTYASVGTDGTVTIFEPGGSQRVFQPDSRAAGHYFSQPGDTGTLTADGHGGFLLTEADGIITDFNPNGSLNYMQDTDGNRITAAYAQGPILTLLGASGPFELTSLTASSGQYIEFTYNAYGLIASLTDSAGRTTTYNYDPTNTYLLSVNGFNGQTTNYTYDAATGAAEGALATITIPGGTHEYFTYDSLGRLTGISQDGGAEPETFTYSSGDVTTTDGTGDKSHTYYNENGQVAKSVDALGNPTYYSYDGNFNLTRITNAADKSETYTYNAAGEVTSSTDFLGNTTTFAYSGPFNKLSSMTDANGNTTQYGYNSSGDLLSTTYADGSVSSSTFNPEGGATSFVNANGQPINYTYNSAGQVTQESFSDGSSYTYTYDANGNMLTATDSTGTTTFTYDPTSELLTEVAYPNGMYLMFSYNAAGQRTQMVDQTGFTVNYIYDADARLSELTDGSGNMIVTYTYDADGRLSEKTNGNGTYTTYAYDADGNVLHLINYAPDGVINSRFDYTYNALGLETTEATLDGTWTYNYDADGQLVHAVFSSMNPNVPSQDLTYNYDAMGNRTSTVINGVTTVYKTNDMNDYTNVGGVGYTYDADGNLTSDGVNTYAYNALNQLVGVSGPSATTSYTYDALGHEVTSMANGQTMQYVIDPSGLGNVVSQYAGAAVQWSPITRTGLGLTSQVTSSGVYYYDYDALGSAVGISDANGYYVDSYAYIPFGLSVGTSQTVANPFQFAGQHGVSVTTEGFYDMRARAYSPSIGAFLSADPLGLNGGDVNTRRYVDNNPLRATDSTGLSGWFDSFLDDANTRLEASYLKSSTLQEC